jgi:hypothetical protein
MAFDDEERDRYPTGKHPPEETLIQYKLEVFQSCISKCGCLELDSSDEECPVCFVTLSNVSI